MKKNIKKNSWNNSRAIYTHGPESMGWGERSKNAMNSNANKVLSTFKNRDIDYAEKTGDFSFMLAKSNKSTIYFRNDFYTRYPKREAA